MSAMALGRSARPAPADEEWAGAAGASSGGAVLTAAAVRGFCDDGYLVVPALCEVEERVRIRDTLLRLFARRAGRNEGNQFDMLSPDADAQAQLQPQILKPSLYAPSLLQGSYFKRVQSIARQLLGADAEFNFDHSILKPAGMPAATPWHQDEAHCRDRLFHSEQISFWMPLQDVCEHNGCMRYVPGSQLGPLLPHQAPGRDPRLHALECSTRHFDATRARAQPVPAGWCILHGGRTLHSALPNCSDRDRLAYVISFRGPPQARSAALHLEWLDAQQTAAAARHLRWLRRGGFLRLALRWLRAALPGHPRRLRARLRAWMRRKRARMR